MAQQQTAINGNRYSFTSVSVEMGNSAIPKGVFRSINYEGTKDPGVMQGNQIVVVGLTTGYGQGSGDFEMAVAELDDFFSNVTNNGQFNVMDVDFDIRVSFSVNDIDVRTDVLRGCRITAVTSSNASGNDATVKSCKLFIRRIWINGLSLFEDPAAA